jgi:hypothetical protein
MSRDVATLADDFGLLLSQQGTVVRFGSEAVTDQSLLPAWAHADL